MLLTAAFFLLLQLIAAQISEPLLADVRFYTEKFFGGDSINVTVADEKCYNLPKRFTRRTMSVLLGSKARGGGYFGVHLMARKDCTGKTVFLKRTHFDLDKKNFGRLTWSYRVEYCKTCN